MIDKLSRIATSLFLFLLPLFFVPIGNLSSDYDKQVLIVFFCVLLFVLSIIKITLEKKLTLVRTPVDFPLLLFGLAFIFSTLVFSPNKIASLTTPMGTGTILALIVLFFTLTQTIDKLSNKLLYPLIASSVLVSLLTIVQQLTINNQQLAIHSLSPLGGLLLTFLFLLPVTAYLVAELIPHLRQIKHIKLILPKIAVLAVISIALATSAFHLLTDQKPLILPFPFGWAIMMEAFKNFSNFLLGVGPTNYSFAYTVGRPAALNATAFWNIITGGSSYFLTLTTEVGAVAAFFFSLIAIKAIGFLSSSASKPYTISLIITLLLQILFPTNIVLLTLTIFLLALAAPKWKAKEIMLAKISYSFQISLIGLISLLVVAVLFYQGKVYLANISFRRAIAAVNDKKLGDAYNHSQAALNYDPYSENYYSLGSSLALSIAQNLAQDRAATDSARNISFLTQQSVAQARTATALNSLNSQNWGQLAAVYQALIGSVQGAEQSALSAYSNQMALDPQNPIPRVGAAGLLLSFSQSPSSTQSAQLLDQARSLLLQAVSLKPDWNNARYTLATYFRLIGRLPDAAAELQRTLDLIPSDSEDYKKVQAELEQLKQLLSKETTPSTATTIRTSPTPIPRSPRSPTPSPSSN